MKATPSQDLKFPELEERALDYWKQNKIFEKSVEKNSDENLYVFYDGPPFISGLPHYGHLLGSIAKDVIPRYWTMKGKKVERVWGWDAHGLTVENKVQKKLGIKNRRDIEKYGLRKFTEECYKYTTEVSAEWRWYVDRIGRWVDMDNAYKTIDKNYMESVMWAFKQLYDKGYIYEGIRTSLYCTTCGTPVSNFEIAMDNSYKEVEDPSVIVKFKIASETFVLAWTTTPWTIPSNRALTVNEDEKYVLVKVDKEKIIMAEKRLKPVFKDKPYIVEDTFLGSKLVGLEYEPPYKFFAWNDKDFKIYPYKEMVSMDEGTGVVHSAPGFGDVDTKMGRHYGLTLMLTVDDEGKFVAGNSGENPFEGMFYAKSNDFIRADLNKRNLLFQDTRAIHRFPYHDRCDTLLIQKAQNSWFIDVLALKTKLLENNKDINWIPPHLKNGRFKIGIEQAPDWCISRNRFWATPMPVWESQDGDRIVVGSVEEIEKLSGKRVVDLHRPFIDEIEFKQNGKTYKRRSEVLDSWLEAGSMPFAQIHYPFENQKKFETNFPGDYIVEYIGQVRAWFYVMHVLSTALFAKNSFKNVISTGVMSGNDGRKMSKTYGNYTDPKDVLLNIGGDALRLYLMGSPLMVGENANFDEVELRNKSKNVLNPLWNSLKFLSLHAKGIPEKVTSSNVLDEWITIRLNETIRNIADSIERYLVSNAVSSLERFVDDLSRWYVRRSRDRISSGDKGALYTLYNILLEFSKAAAPIIPFISENIYQQLGGRDSVHLCDFPSYDEELIKRSDKLQRTMENTRNIVSLALSVRSSHKIGVRQPLAKLEVSINDVFFDLISDEVNVKQVIFNPGLESRGLTINLDTKMTEDLEVEGAAREIIRKIQDLRKVRKLSINQRITAHYQQSLVNDRAVNNYGDFIKAKVLADSLFPGAEYKIID